jgi:hypothetical protein
LEQQAYAQERSRIEELVRVDAAKLTDKEVKDIFNGYCEAELKYYEKKLTEPNHEPEIEERFSLLKRALQGNTPAREHIARTRYEQNMADFINRRVALLPGERLHGASQIVRTLAVCNKIVSEGTGNEPIQVSHPKKM